MSVDPIVTARRLLLQDGPDRFVDDLREDDLPQLGWSGDQLHLEAVARELQRARAGEAAYFAVRIGGVPYAKAAIDFARDPAVGFVWQVDSHPALRRLGMATALMEVVERRIIRRGRHRARLTVETHDPLAERLYRRLGYEVVGSDTESWPTVGEAGEELYTTDVVVMEKDLGGRG